MPLVFNLRNLYFHLRIAARVFNLHIPKITMEIDVILW